MMKKTVLGTAVWVCCGADVSGPLLRGVPAYVDVRKLQEPCEKGKGDGKGTGEAWIEDGWGKGKGKGDGWAPPPMGEWGKGKGKDWAPPPMIGEGEWVEPSIGEDWGKGTSAEWGPPKGKGKGKGELLDEAFGQGDSGKHSSTGKSSSAGTSSSSFGEDSSSTGEDSSSTGASSSTGVGSSTGNSKFRESGTGDTLEEDYFTGDAKFEVRKQGEGNDADLEKEIDFFGDEGFSEELNVELTEDAPTVEPSEGVVKPVKDPEAWAGGELWETDAGYELGNPLGAEADADQHSKSPDDDLDIYLEQLAHSSWDTMKKLVQKTYEGAEEWTV